MRAGDGGFDAWRCASASVRDPVGTVRWVLCQRRRHCIGPASVRLAVAFL